MGRENSGSYVLKFQRDEFTLEPEEWRLDEGLEYVVRFAGDVLWRRQEEDDDEVSSPPGTLDRVVGRFQGYVIQAARALNDGVDLWDHCDAHSQDLSDYATTFYDESGLLKESLEDVFALGGEGQDLLIIDEIALHPDHRGNLVGLRTIRRLIELLGGGCGFAATIPCPLQFQEASEPAREPAREFDRHPEPDRKRAERRLGRYLERLGFQALLGTPMYAMAMTYGLPSLKPVADRQGKVLPFVRRDKTPDPDIHLP